MSTPSRLRSHAFIGMALFIGVDVGNCPISDTCQCLWLNRATPQARGSACAPMHLTVCYRRLAEAGKRPNGTVWGGLDTACGVVVERLLTVE
jgi:hypothetical protein